MQSDVARVINEHAVLDREAVTLEAAIAAGPAHAGESFIRLAAYASLLSEHLLGEHDVMQAAHAKTEDGGERSAQMRSELDGLRWDWDEYLSVWTQESAERDWETFSEHSLAILDRIRRRIGRENSMLGA